LYNIENETEYFFWLDLCVYTRLSLLPLMALMLAESKSLKVLSALYFAWTFTNPIGLIIEYTGYAELWMVWVKIGGAGVIASCFLYLNWKEKNEPTYL